MSVASNQHNFVSNQVGFSLIELMVTISVFAIIVSIAFPSYQQFIANTQIRTVAESIRNGLQIARAEAVKRNETVTFTLNNNNSWTVGCTPATATCPINIQAKLANEGSSIAVAKSTVTLGITGTNTIGFTSLGTVTAVAGQMSRVNVDNSALTPAQSKDLRITIGAGGNARVCDPNVVLATDSRFCS